MAKKPLFIAIRTLLHSIKPLLRYDCTPFALQNKPFWSAKRPLLLRNAVLLELRRCTSAIYINVLRCISITSVLHAQNSRISHRTSSCSFNSQF